MSASPSLAQAESGWCRVDTKSGRSLVGVGVGRQVCYVLVKWMGVKEVREIKSQCQAVVLLCVPFPRRAMTLDLDIS